MYLTPISSDFALSPANANAGAANVLSYTLLEMRGGGKTLIINHLYNTSKPNNII
jgi:hypothetical protein